MDEIVEMFSTDLGFADSNGRLVIRGRSNRNLATNIKSLVQAYPDANVDFFARMFVNDLRQNNFRHCSTMLASKHLAAFLQKIGRNRAESVYTECQNFPQTIRHYTQEDCYQIAWLVASNPADFFRNFNFSHSVASYTYSKMEGKIRDEIERHLGRRRSDWSLLYYESRKYLKQALQARWSDDQMINCHLYARDCFKEIYVPYRSPGSNRLSGPTVEKLHAIADLYNQRVQPTQPATLENIKDWLNEDIEALRCYQNIDLVSLDAPSSKNESSPPVYETIPDPASESDGGLIDAIDVQELAKQLMDVLRQFLVDIQEYHSQLLLLKCGFDLSFRLIAPFFGFYYTTVRLHYNGIRNTLLDQIVQWAQQNQSLIPNSEMISEISVQLEECLNKHYKDFIVRSVFQHALSSIDCQHKRILHLRYFTQMNETEIARQLQTSEQEVVNRLVIGKEKLERAIASWLQNYLEASPDLLILVRPQIAQLVKTLVANYFDYNLH